MSKTRCSLAQPQCSRCQAQGSECIYDGLLQQQSTESKSNLQQQKSDLTTGLPQNISFTTGTLSSDYTAGSFNASSSSSDVQQSTHGWNANYLHSARDPFFNSTNQWQTAPDFSSYTLNDVDVAQSRTSTELMQTYQVYTTSKFAASLLSQAISAFPQMMLRRQTFPPFIHAHWHLPSLPETLANCMSIAQLFATRTAETRPFLWRTIGVEVKRLQDEVHSHKWLSTTLSN